MNLNDIVKALNDDVARSSAEWATIKAAADAALADAQAKLDEAEQTRTEALLGSEPELMRADKARNAALLNRDRAAAAAAAAERRLMQSKEEEAATAEVKRQAEIKATIKELLDISDSIDRLVSDFTKKIGERAKIIAKLDALAPENEGYPKATEDALAAIASPISRELGTTDVLSSQSIYYACTRQTTWQPLRAVDTETIERWKKRPAVRAELERQRAELAAS